ncbi:MAG: cytochrome b N-terminal domain-containing protein [Anaerolineales bacterium]|nr:MAG: cytochrome b N-terminal domain-containing protein [Anaerolineales bacterium]
MRKYYKKIVLFTLLLVIVLFAGALGLITTHAGTFSDSDNRNSNVKKPDFEQIKNTLVTQERNVNLNDPSANLPPPEKDPCLHCHISGENKNLWMPFIRWSLFGGVGLVFAYGLYRGTSAWRIRKPWRPIPQTATEWLDERYKIVEPISKVLNKPVPKFALRWWYCLGGITAFLFIVQGITGIMLSFYYKPTPEAAYASIQYIETQVRFGSAVRMIHHWAANGMIVMCIAHMLRVFIMGAYKPPRELNWVSGVVLLGLTLLFGFTGYLLPWDQRAYWATTVGTEIAGSIPGIGNLALVFLRVGWDVGALTLSRFYSLHVLVTPLATLLFMLSHFLMVRRQGVARPL